MVNKPTAVLLVGYQAGRSDVLSGWGAHKRRSMRLVFWDVSILLLTVHCYIENLRFVAL